MSNRFLTNSVDDEFLPAYGRQLRAARLARNLSQGALAARVKMSKKHYQRVETGVQLPQLRTLAKLARELGLQVTLTKVSEGESE